MTPPERWDQIRLLFDHVNEHSSAARERVLDDACTDDPSLRAEVESLLAADARTPDGFPGGDEVGPVSVAGTLGWVPALGTDADKQSEAGARAPMREVQTGVRKYLIVRTLGEGGMGTVYLAYERDLRRFVALKMTRTEVDPSHGLGLLAEAQVLGRLQHPNILPVHEVGLTEDRRLYYTMPLVNGRTLRATLDDLRQPGKVSGKAAWSLAHLVQIFLLIGQAVSYAHSKGVIHRDLKPANVMIGEHGEVLVLDWGLAEMSPTPAPTAEGMTGQEAPGRLLGTPAYMSPEQATRQKVDFRTDVYALGTLLYEILTLERPFAGEQLQILQAIVRDEPVPPRVRASARWIPPELERVCLKALAKRPDDRQQTVAELVAEVQGWLLAEASRAERHARSEDKALEGGRHLAEYFRERQEVGRLAAELEQAAERFESWQPAATKTDLIAAEEAVGACNRRVVELAAETVDLLEQAVEYEPANATARELLADYYWDRFQEADRRSQREDRDFLAKRVARYHDGKYAKRLAGDGSLTLTSDPPGAEVWLHELVEEGFVLVERNARQLGVTPLSETGLKMGSYVVDLKRDGYRDTRYPVSITRNLAWKGGVRLCTVAEIGRGFVYVPGGTCVLGGDAKEFNSWPRREVVVEDFFLSVHPVTMAEYLEYVNEVARNVGVEAAKLLSPRRAVKLAAASYLVEDGAGGLQLPELDLEGDQPTPRHPAVGIAWHDAAAYCAWRSARDGCAYRLPTEEEWEKAARGVDGRWYPWGWRFDASLCNVQGSLRGRPSLVEVDEFPQDVSVYGVRGLGGNTRDWTAGGVVYGDGDTQRVDRFFRGGHWDAAARGARAAYRGWGAATIVNDGTSLRLARSRR